MFRPDSNRDRTDYSGILMPPDGYRLDRAVGTTYSLDLEALTAVAICLGLSEETDSKLMQNPIEKQSCICRFYLPDDLRLTLLRDLRGGEHLIVVYNIASAATQITAERQPTDHRRQTADGPSGVDK